MINRTTRMGLALELDMATDMERESETNLRPTKRTRLVIDISPELRRRIKSAAADRDLSVRSYVERILDESVPRKVSRVPQRQLQPVTREYADALFRLQQEIARSHPGVVFEDSAETVRRMREERSEHLANL